MDGWIGQSKMATLARVCLSKLKSGIITQSLRYLSITPRLNIKEIQKQLKGNTLIVQGVTLPSPRADLLVKPDPNVTTSDGRETCYMCALGLDVKHTDVLILSQFVRSDGCMLPRRITGLCKMQQKKIGKMVTMAQKAGLMINLTPQHCKKDPTKRRKWKQFNTYYDEKTIFMKRLPKQLDRFRRSGSLYFD